MNPLLNFLLGPVLDKLLAFIPDPQQREAAKLQLMQLQQSEEFKLIDAQLAIAAGQSAVNLAEAQSESKFKSFWRPAVGWICVLGMAWQFVLAPLITWIAVLTGSTAKFPALDSNTLMTLLFAMLGVGTLRTVDKVKGVTS